MFSQNVRKCFYHHFIRIVSKLYFSHEGKREKTWPFWQQNPRHRPVTMVTKQQSFPFFLRLAPATRRSTRFQRRRNLCWLTFHRQQEHGDVFSDKLTSWLEPENKTNPIHKHKVHIRTFLTARRSQAWGTR